MMWYENPVLRATLQSAFKRSNARIANLAKQYGRSSAIYKKETDKFFAPNYKQFMSISQAGKKVGRNITTGGNLKFDVKKLNKYILSGNADRGTVNQLLSEAVGLRIDANGNIEPVKQGGIKTITQIRKSASKTARNMGINPHEMTNQELDKFANEITDFSSNFQVAYDAFIARYGEDVARKDPYIGQMYDRKKALSYSKMIEINRRFNAYKNNEKMLINEFEDYNGGDL